MRKYDKNTKSLYSNDMYYYMLKKFHYFFVKEFDDIYDGLIEIRKMKTKWDKYEIRKYLLELNKKKPVIMCGDLNVAHEEIDLKNPKTNKGNAGFTNEEREKMTELLNAGFIDSYRYLYPEKIEYSWWSYMGHAREKNVGWRIDYFIVSNDFRENIKDATIYTEILGSDHCPVGLEIK